MIRVGILGTGFGKAHAKIYQAVEGVEIAGVFGRDRTKLAEIHETFGVKVTDDIQELIHDPGIDLIDICLPTSLHAEYAVQAMDCGKDVFCETPAAPSVRDAVTMQECARRNQRGLFVDLFYKFSAPHRHALNLVRDGLLGNPMMVSAYSKTAPVWGDLGLDSIVIQFMLHNLDFLVEVMGTPQTVTAAGFGRKDGAFVSAQLQYADGLAAVECASLMPETFPFTLGFSVIGTSGAMTYDGRFSEEAAERGVWFPAGGEAQVLSLPEVNEYEAVIRHVVNCIQKGTPSPLISIDQAIAALQIAEAVNESLKLQCPVSLHSDVA